MVDVTAGLSAGEGASSSNAARWLAALTPAGVLAALEAEQDRWFLWLPVFLGAGIASYFQLSGEPHLLAALMPLPIALIISALWRQGSIAVMVTGILVAMALGFALAKVRTELIRAPVLERQFNFAEIRGFVELVEPRPTRGQRITLQLVSFAGLPAERRPHRVRVRTLSTLAGLKPGDGLRLRQRSGHLAFRHCRTTTISPARPGTSGLAASATRWRNRCATTR